MPEITPEYIAQLRELVNEFDFPLELVPDSDDDIFLSILDDKHYTKISLIYENESKTANFLVAAANALPALLDEYERMREALEWIMMHDLKLYENRLLHGADVLKLRAYTTLKGGSK